ncbi:MAG: glutamate--tRNA ligase [Candidatus Portnoybacteria bacterium]|nr:glutamate--tRNA ligase [Candidatus Portnoybacteria bacterium]
MSKTQKIRVRIAPSPTGPLHIGVTRTALFNYLFAQKNKGKFILRIEDTDIERSEKKYEKDIIDNLKWLGLNWDEGPYKQSQRTKIYQKYIKKLLDSKQAFWCDHSKEELEKEKKEQMAHQEAPRHICNRKDKAKKGIIRFRCPDKKIVFNDLIRGRLEFDGGLLGDIGIAKDEKTPLYNFSVVIDDHEMKISHVIRGEDHISNTPKQILIGQALGFPQLQFAHLPLILGPDKSKLSKRHGAVSVGWYKKQGYLPEAMINFMVLLGWNPGTEKEIFSLKELIKEFSLERVQKGGAVFNLQRLDWLNGHYIRQMDLDKLTEKCLPYLEKKVDFDYAKKIVALEQERLKKLSEIGELTRFFFLDKLDYQPELLIWKKMTLKQVKNNLDILEKTLSKMVKFDRKSLERALMPLAKKHGSGELLWPLRVALTGQKASPSPFEIAEILGKEKTLKMIKEAKKLIK